MIAGLDPTIHGATVQLTPWSSTGITGASFNAIRSCPTACRSGLGQPETIRRASSASP